MKKSISKARSGDVVCADRGFYRHYGIYDQGNVIDISPDKGGDALSNKHNALIRERPLEDFLGGCPGYVDNSPGFHSRKETVRRARAEIGAGRNSYDLIFNNCEHKAREWQTGQKQSNQVDDAIEMIVSIISGFFD